MNVLEILRQRNEALFIFGAVNLILAMLFLILSRTTNIEVAGTNAWYKPIKFALSIGIFSWTMAWFTGYLEPGRGTTIFNWAVILSLGFAILYIGLQAGRGQLSHFNISTPLYSGLYNLMAIAATTATLAAAYIGYRFFVGEFPELPVHYLWAIRIGILLFVIFSFEGFVMGSRLSHTIGGPDGGAGLPFLNWSRTFGDPRVAHFVGMHAMQVLPLLSFYVLKDVKLTFVAGGVYAALAVYVLVQALQAQPFLKFIQ